MKRTAAVLVGLALISGLAACSDDEPPTSAVSDTAETTASADPSAGGDASPGAGAGPAPSSSATSAPATPSRSAPQPTDGEAPVPFPADTSADEEQPAGGPLSVQAVRVAPHDGYDRVVFELGGRNPGQPGWQVQYVDDPSRQGSGEPVQLDGQALHVSISGTGYPMDTGVEELSGEPALPAGLRRVRDLELGGVFEGQYEAFIGVSERAPFRVFRLDDPARVVIDIRTG